MIEIFSKKYHRNIRIFLSSTFRDMMMEREHLVKIIFPQIRKYCKDRLLEITEIDLRWGITEEEARQGKVIQTCMNEIDRSRPYFIGILGERYGWIPESSEYKKHRKIIEDFPWIKEDIKNELSITEMEIQYGVLRNDGMIGHAFFYIKDESCINSENAVSPNYNKLKILKNTLKNQKKYPCKIYSSIESLGDMVLNDLKILIEKEFPLRDVENIHNKHRIGHLSHLNELTRFYSPNKDHLHQLNKHLKSGISPLTILGDTGAGKSALIANWLKKVVSHRPDTYVLYYCVGVNENSAQPKHILEYMLKELKDAFELSSEIPTEIQQMMDALPIFLKQCNKEEKWLLIIDGLDKIDFDNNTSTLEWLPNSYPESACVIYSMVYEQNLLNQLFFKQEENNILKDQTTKQMNILTINPLDIIERKTLIEKYYAHYSKKMEPTLVDLVASNELTAYPYYLLILLNEIRIFGLHEKLRATIEEYLQSEEAVVFLGFVLDRFEKDYEVNYPGLVGQVFRVLYYTENIREKDIINILSLPPMYWGPLANAIEPLVQSTNGSYTISTTQLLDLIYYRYVKGNNEQKHLIDRIVTYFEGQPKEFERNKLLLDLYFKFNIYEKIVILITDPSIFFCFYNNYKKYLLYVWKNMPKDLKISDLLLQKLEAELDSSVSLDVGRKAFNKLSSFFTEVKAFNEAFYCAHKALRYAEQERSRFKIGVQQYILGRIYYDYSDDQNSIFYLEKALLHFRTYPKKAVPYNIYCYITIANIYKINFKIARAKQYYENAQRLINKYWRQKSLSNAEVYKGLSDIYLEELNLDKALEKLLYAQNLLVELVGSQHPRLNEVYLSLAVISQFQNDFDMADYYYEQIEETIIDFYGEEDIQLVDIYVERSKNYTKLEQYDKAIKYAFFALDIVSSLEEEENFSYSFFELSTLVAENLECKGEYQEATATYRMAIDSAMEESNYSKEHFVDIVIRYISALLVYKETNSNELKEAKDYLIHAQKICINNEVCNDMLGTIQDYLKLMS